MNCKKGRAYLLALLLALSATKVASAQIPACGNAATPDKIARLKDEFKQIQQALSIPGMSVAVAQEGKIVWTEGFGYADYENKTPAGPDTLYRIGSITKTFTSTLMLQLVEQGKLKLDWAVADYVTWEVPPEIKIRHVLSHTSEGVPGSRYRYSSRFNWLDNVVEAATGESFRHLAIQGILKPANLTHTIPGDDAPWYEHALRNAAKPHRLDSEGRIVIADFPPAGFHSSSGISSTAVDLAKFSMALDDGSLLSRESLELAFSPTLSTRGEALPYGLGWFTQNPPGLRLVRHGGWWPTFSGLLLKLPERQLTLVVLANSDAVSAPLQGEANVLISPFAAAFLRIFVLDAWLDPPLPSLNWSAPVEAVASEAARVQDSRARFYFGNELVARGLLARAQGDPDRSDALLRLAIKCCPGAVEANTDEGLLRLFGQSADPVVRALGQQAGKRRMAAFPDDGVILFNLALSYGEVLKEYRVQGPRASEAIALFERVLTFDAPVPDWAEAWSSYLIAEHIRTTNPARARALLERALSTGVDTDGLRDRASQLLSRLQD